MAQKFTNIETYLVILFLFAILAGGIVYLGNELILNDNADLDNDSINYIANLQGINISEYKATQADLESTILINDNSSQGNPKDQSLDFLFAKEKGFDIELTIKRIFGLPSFILVDLFRFQLNDWKWIIDIIGWLLSITIVVALVYYARGIIRQ